MSYSLTFSRQAKETYSAIQSQLYNRWGQRVLKKFERKTIKTLDLILQSPLMFKSMTDYPSIRKGLIHKNCSVFYEVKTNEIEVLFFWDNRQDPVFL
ncbi:MAG: type II toxin-antitoxin system RelE/ParE family toxin [Sphingobacteriales bacterium]